MAQMQIDEDKGWRRWHTVAMYATIAGLVLIAILFANNLIYVPPGTDMTFTVLLLGYGVFGLTAILFVLRWKQIMSPQVRFWIQIALIFVMFLCFLNLWFNAA